MSDAIDDDYEHFLSANGETLVISAADRASLAENSNESKCSPTKPNVNNKSDEIKKSVIRDHPKINYLMAEYFVELRDSLLEIEQARKQCQQREYSRRNEQVSRFEAGKSLITVEPQRPWSEQINKLTGNNNLSYRSLNELEDILKAGEVILKDRHSQKVAIVESIQTESNHENHLYETSINAHIEAINQIRDILHTRLKDLEELCQDRVRPNIEAFIYEEKNKLLLLHQEEINKKLKELAFLETNNAQKKDERRKLCWADIDCIYDKHSYIDYRSIEKELEEGIEKMHLDLQKLRSDFQFRHDDLEHQRDTIKHGHGKLKIKHMKQKKEHFRARTKLVHIKGKYNLAWRERQKKVTQLQSTLNRYSIRKANTQNKFEQTMMRSHSDQTPVAIAASAAHQEEIAILQSKLHNITHQITVLLNLCTNDGSQVIIDQEKWRLLWTRLDALTQKYHESLEEKRRSINNLIRIKEENVALQKQLQTCYTNPDNEKLAIPPSGCWSSDQS